MKRRIVAGLASLAVAVTALAAVLIVWPAAGNEVAAEQPSANQVSKLMRLKLGHAERVLEAVAMEDFDLLAKESQALSLLTQEEVFQVLVTPEYVRHSTEFRRSADALTKAAREKNIDAAALSYVDMTMKCVNCHKYVRDVRMASLPGFPTWR